MHCVRCDRCVAMQPCCACMATCMILLTGGMSSHQHPIPETSTVIYTGQAWTHNHCAQQVHSVCCCYGLQAQATAAWTMGSGCLPAPHPGDTPCDLLPSIPPTHAAHPHHPTTPHPASQLSNRPEISEVLKGHCQLSQLLLPPPQYVEHGAQGFGQRLDVGGSVPGCHQLPGHGWQDALLQSPTALGAAAHGSQQPRQPPRHQCPSHPARRVVTAAGKSC